MIINAHGLHRTNQFLDSPDKSTDCTYIFGNRTHGKFSGNHGQNDHQISHKLQYMKHQIFQKSNRQLFFLSSENRLISGMMIFLDLFRCQRFHTVHPDLHPRLITHKMIKQITAHTVKWNTFPHHIHVDLFISYID